MSSSGDLPHVATILATKSPSVEGSLFPKVSWQQALKTAIRSGNELCSRLSLDPKIVCEQAESDFAVFAPQEFVARIQPGNAQDPLLRQIISSQGELNENGSLDPVGDMNSVRLDGLLQKYQHRVLLVTTGACAIHCRYCFRRHFPYENVSKGKKAWQAWIDYLSRDRSIDEVILSGGDPLSVADTRLKWFVEELNALQHVRRLRVHTRFPVIIPQRVCPALIDWIQTSKQTVYFVLHFNHVQEVDENVLRAIAELRLAGASILNQTVLLRGINDRFETLRDLFLELTNHHVQPYYLHQLDPVRGAAHFEVADQRAIELMDRLRAELPGYAVPKLVREIAGETSKTPI